MIYGTCFWRSHLLFCCRTCSVHCTSSASSHLPRPGVEGPSRSWRDIWLLLLWSNCCWARLGLFCPGDIVSSTSSPSSATSDPAHLEAFASSIGEGFSLRLLIKPFSFFVDVVVVVLSQRNCSMTHGNFSKQRVCFVVLWRSILDPHCSSASGWANLILVDRFGSSANSVLIPTFRSGHCCFLDTLTLQRATYPGL